MMNRKISSLLIVCGLLISSVLAISAHAEMSSSNYKIPFDVIGAGGGETSSASYILRENIGESFIQQSVGTNYGVQEGFLYGINTSITLTIVNGPISFGSLNPGAGTTDTINVQITTDAWNGYSLGTYMDQHSNASCGDRYALCKSSGSDYLANIAATIASPQAWSGDGMGFTVYGGTGVDAKWNTGDNYAKIPSSETALHIKTGYYAPATGYDQTDLRFRVQVPSSQNPGSYTNTSYFTVTAAL